MDETMKQNITKVVVAVVLFILLLCTITATTKYDKLKNEYAKFHNIPLKRIPYWDFDKITLENIMSDKWLINN